jgi:hypothetical protein
MNHCVNINSKEFKDLVKVANMNPVILAAKVSIWQEENGLDKFPKLSQLMSENAINYVMDAAQILSSPEADVVFKKAEKGKWPLDKILTELQIPKTQKEIILQSGKTDRKDIVTDLLVNYSYAVEINTAKTTEVNNNPVDDDTRYYEKDGKYYKSSPYENEAQPLEITKEQYEAYTTLDKPTAHYANLTVPGGTNYTENEIATPAITPSIKGHADFATDKGIGWFRSDDKALESGIENRGYWNPYTEEVEYDNEMWAKGSTKIRRILEVQSDLFQKGRDKEQLSRDNINKSETSFIEDRFQDNEGNTYEYKEGKYFGSYEYYKNNNEITKEKYYQVKNSLYKNTSNQFLQLLNKDNNWVTFFVKSIIQDSAKKGYEKVLFPTDQSIIPIETQGNFKNIKEARDGFDWTIEKEQDWLKRKKEAKTQEEKDTIHNERPSIFGTVIFYESLKGVLEKQFGKENVKQVTDEYGNTWNEVELDENKKQSISLTSKNFNNFVNETYEESMFSFLTKESDHREYFNNCK